MVAPAWGSFQRPNDTNQDIEEDTSQLPEFAKDFIEEDPGEIQDSQEPEGEKPQWGNFQSPETYQGEPDPTEDESTVGYFIRNIAQNASRLGEQYFGRFGNMEKAGKDILSNLPATGGLLGVGLQKLLGQERWERMVKGQEGNQQLLPTSENLKEISKDITGGYTKPKTKGEENFQSYIEDIGSTLGSRRPMNLRNIAVNNVGIPVASNAVKDVIEGLGFGKGKGMIGKLGTWFSLSLLGNVNAPRYASDLTNEGRNGIPQNVNFDTVRLNRRLDQVDRQLLSADPRSALARQELDAVRRDIANGQTSVRSLMTSYDGVNAAKRNRGLFEFGRDDREFARISIDRVKNAVRDEIVEAGNAYPQSIDSWRNGIQAWAVIHQSRAVTNTIDSWARGPYAKILAGPAAALFGVGSYASYTKPLIAGPASIAIPAGYKTMQTAYRVWEDPRLANYYWNAISAANRENAPAFVSNYNKLNKALETSNSVKKKAKSKK